MTYGPVEIDRSDPTTIHTQYQSSWQSQRTQNQQNYAWFQNRIKLLGYKSVAEFRRKNSEISVTAGTLSNWFRFGTTPLWAVPRLCYTLKVTPNTLLAILGYYDPSRQQEIPVITQ